MVASTRLEVVTGIPPTVTWFWPVGTVALPDRLNTALPVTLRAIDAASSPTPASPMPVVETPRTPMPAELDPATPVDKASLSHWPETPVLSGAVWGVRLPDQPSTPQPFLDTPTTPRTDAPIPSGAPSTPMLSAPPESTMPLMPTPLVRLQDLPRTPTEPAVPSASASRPNPVPRANMPRESGSSDELVPTTPAPSAESTLPNTPAAPPID